MLDRLKQENAQQPGGKSSEKSSKKKTWRLKNTGQEHDRLLFQYQAEKRTRKKPTGRKSLSLRRPVVFKSKTPSPR